MNPGAGPGLVGNESTKTYPGRNSGRQEVLILHGWVE